MTARPSVAPTGRSPGARTTAGGRSVLHGHGARRRRRYAEANLSKHLLGALQWTTGLVRGDCKATISSSNYRATRVRRAPARRPPASPPAGESHGLSIASQRLGRLHRPRGDCRTDAERGALIGLPSLGPRSSTTPTRTSASACGTVHILDPSQYTGAENSGVTKAGVPPRLRRRRHRRRAHDEVNHKMEYRPPRHRRCRPTSPQTGPRLPRSTSRPSTRERQAQGPGRSSAASRRCRSRASRASRSTCRPSSST